MNINSNTPTHCMALVSRSTNNHLLLYLCLECNFFTNMSLLTLIKILISIQFYCDCSWSIVNNIPIYTYRSKTSSFSLCNQSILNISQPSRPGLLTMEIVKQSILQNTKLIYELNTHQF